MLAHKKATEHRPEEKSPWKLHYFLFYIQSLGVHSVPGPCSPNSFFLRFKRKRKSRGAVTNVSAFSSMGALSVEVRQVTVDVKRGPVFLGVLFSLSASIRDLNVFPPRSTVDRPRSSECCPRHCASKNSSLSVHSLRRAIDSGRSDSELLYKDVSKHAHLSSAAPHNPTLGPFPLLVTSDSSNNTLFSIVKRGASSSPLFPFQTVFHFQC